MEQKETLMIVKTTSIIRKINVDEVWNQLTMNVPKAEEEVNPEVSVVIRNGTKCHKIYQHHYGENCS